MKDISKDTHQRLLDDRCLRCFDYGSLLHGSTDRALSPIRKNISTDTHLGRQTISVIRIKVSLLYFLSSGRLSRQPKKMLFTQPETNQQPTEQTMRHNVYAMFLKIHAFKLLVTNNF